MDYCLNLRSRGALQITCYLLSYKLVICYVVLEANLGVDATAPFPWANSLSLFSGSGHVTWQRTRYTPVVQETLYGKAIVQISLPILKTTPKNNPCVFRLNQIRFARMKFNFSYLQPPRFWKRGSEASNPPLASPL